MKLSWEKYKLEMRQAFVLSYGTFNYRESIIVKLEADGFIGLGEASAISYYGWTIEKIESELHEFNTHLDELVRFETLLHTTELSPPTRNALQCAYVDWTSKKENSTLSEYYSIPTVNESIISSITITGNTTDELENQIRLYDWPVYKIKMGSQHDDNRLALIGNYPGKKFRIDANGGWSLDWIKANRTRLNEQNIELIEQPFATGSENKIAALKEMIHKDIFADESCQTIADLEKHGELFDGVNVKLMKCGGWDRAVEIINRAQKLNLQIMIGCMTETSIGISHSSHLLGLANYADIDGAQLLKNDPALGTKLEYGKIIFGHEKGCGASLLKL